MLKRTQDLFLAWAVARGPQPQNLKNAKVENIREFTRIHTNTHKHTQQLNFIPVHTPTKEACQKVDAPDPRNLAFRNVICAGIRPWLSSFWPFSSLYLCVCLCVKGTDLWSGHIHCEQHVQKTCRTPRHLLSRSSPVGPLPSCDRDAGSHTHTRLHVQSGGKQASTDELAVARG